MKLPQPYVSKAAASRTRPPTCTEAEGLADGAFRFHALPGAPQCRWRRRCPGIARHYALRRVAADHSRPICACSGRRKFNQIGRAAPGGPRARRAWQPDLPRLRRPDGQVTKEVTTGPDNAKPGQTSSDTTHGLTCDNRPQRDTVRRNRAARHAEGQGFESPYLQNFSDLRSISNDSPTIGAACS
jgi:hypothetical protein